MLRRYWRSLCARFGRPATFAIVVLTLCNAVIRAGATFLAQYDLKLELGLPPAAAQAYMAAVVAGWALKPLFGTVTDALPLCGLRYKPYVCSTACSASARTWCSGWRRRAGWRRVARCCPSRSAPGGSTCCAMRSLLGRSIRRQLLLPADGGGDGGAGGGGDGDGAAGSGGDSRAAGAVRRAAAAELQSMSIGVFAVGSLVGTALAGLLFSLLGSSRQCFGLAAAIPLVLVLLPRVMADEGASADRDKGRRPVAAAALAAGAEGGGLHARRQRRAGLDSVWTAWAALRPAASAAGGGGGGGHDGGGAAVLRAALFVALSAAAVPDISQSTFAFYVDTDRAEWAVNVTHSGSEELQLVGCQRVAELLAAGAGARGAGAGAGRSWNAAAADGSGCADALPLRGYLCTTVLRETAAVRIETLADAAAVHCPASCGQCGRTRRGCLQFGPQFLTLLTMLQNASSLLGAVLFQRLLAALPLRRAFFRISLVLPVAACCDLILAMRWNVAAGLDDHLFAGVDTVMYYTATSLKTIAVYTLVTAICPPDVEATLFSWIMGGWTCSSPGHCTSLDVCRAYVRRVLSQNLTAAPCLCLWLAHPTAQVGCTSARWHRSPSGRGRRRRSGSRPTTTRRCGSFAPCALAVFSGRCHCCRWCQPRQQ